MQLEAQIRKVKTSNLNLRGKSMDIPGLNKSENKLFTKVQRISQANNNMKRLNFANSVSKTLGIRESKSLDLERRHTVIDVGQSFNFENQNGMKKEWVESKRIKELKS
jgi:hypothetical protein